MTPRLQVENLHVLRGGAAAVCGVSLDADKGEWLGMVGANGSGKTSLLRAIGGRLPVARGSVKIAGVECGGDRAHRAARIGFAADASSLPEALTPRELFDIVGDGAWESDRTLEGLREAIALSRVLDRDIAALSTGLRQRVAIYAAFIGRPEIVLLDEPFNWLDPLTAYDMKAQLRCLVDGGLTLVTALHDLTTLTVHCDRGFLLASGQVSLDLDASALALGRRDPAAFDREIVGHLRPRA